MSTNLVAQNNADLNIGKSTETLNPLNGNIYMILLTMENCKKTHKILEQRIQHLKQFDSITESGARKKQAIPKLESEQNMLKELFASLVPVVENWVANFAPENKIFATAILEHYCKFDSLPQQLHEKLDLLGMYMTAGNFRAKIQQIWLESFN